MAQRIREKEKERVALQKRADDLQTMLDDIDGEEGVAIVERPSNEA